MTKFHKYLLPFAGGSALTPGLNKNVKNFLVGTPEKRENVSTLRDEQEPLYQQAVNAGLNQGAGGAFGDAADYYRGLVSGDSEDYNNFAAPQLRQYNEDIVPGISEQFAGLGAGGLSSSGFRNAQVQGATDLSERLGQIRANLRQQGAQGLQNIGQIGLNNYSQNQVTQQGSPGFLSQIAPAAAKAGLAYLTGGASIPSELANEALNSFGQDKVGANSGAYGANGPQASARTTNVGQRLF